MNMAEKYIIGDGPAPKWCAGLIMHYQKRGGNVGYEFHGVDRDFELKRGDALIYKNGKIYVVRRDGR